MTDPGREAEPGFDYADALRACAAGDRGALRRLYERDADWLLGVAHRIVRDRGLAEDAVRDGFVRVWRHAAGFDPLLGSGRAWIFTIVRHRALDIVRERGRDAPVGEERLAEVPDSAADPQAALGRVAAGPLRGCLERLEPVRRSGLLLAYLDGYSDAQIAARLNLPPGTAKAWLRRSLALLRRCLA